MCAVGYERGMVACGNDMQPGNGMDELSVTGKTLLIEFFNGTRNKIVIHPQDMGLPCVSLQEIMALNKVSLHDIIALIITQALARTVWTSYVYASGCKTCEIQDFGCR